MNPLLIAGGLVLLVILSSNKGISNVFNPANLFTTGSGPGQNTNKAKQGNVGNFGPPNYQRGTGTGSPGSTLATVNNAMIVVNNALGQIDKLATDYFPEAGDSEYPQTASVNYPTSIAPSQNDPATSIAAPQAFPSIFATDQSVPDDSNYVA